MTRRRWSWSTCARPTRAASRRCAACRSTVAQGELVGDRRPVRVGQVDAAARHGHARAADRAAWSASPATTPARWATATLAALRARRDRLRVPAVLPARRAERAGERRHRAAVRGRRRGASGGRRARRRSSGSAWATALDQVVGQAVRRRAPARGDRPGAGRAARRSCSPTSRPATSTAARARGSSRCCASCTTQGTTIVVITHDREIAAAFPRRIALRDGRVESATRGASSPPRAHGRHERRRPGAQPPGRLRRPAHRLARPAHAAAARGAVGARDRDRDRRDGRRARHLGVARRPTCWRSSTGSARTC